MAFSESSHREILHLDMDTFFVSVERLKNRLFCNKPLIIGGGDRGVVASCSYEARKFGVRSAMPMRVAKRLCPEATVISGDYDDYLKYSNLVTEVVSSQVPVCEKASIDEFYADLSGMGRFHDCETFSANIKARITKETGLPISYALASNKLISKIATSDAKPNNHVTIPFGYEKAYLAPLPIERMPGIGEKTALLLRQLGVRTLAMLTQIPEPYLIKRFGKTGLDLFQKASGIDESPIIPFREPKSIGSENTFSSDTIDMRYLDSEIVRMSEKITFDLRSQNKLAGCISVKLRYSDFNTCTRQALIPYTSSDEAIISKAKEIFHKLYEKRLFVRLIGVRLTHLVSGTHQISLYDDTEEMIQLYKAMDSIKTQFGEQYVKRASGMIAKKDRQKRSPCI